MTSGAGVSVIQSGGNGWGAPHGHTVPHLVTNVSDCHIVTRCPMRHMSAEPKWCSLNYPKGGMGIFGSDWSSRNANLCSSQTCLELIFIFWAQIKHSGLFQVYKLSEHTLSNSRSLKHFCLVIALTGNLRPQIKSTYVEEDLQNPKKNIILVQ